MAHRLISVKQFIFFIAILLVPFCFHSCTQNSQKKVGIEDTSGKGEVIIFHAGSLSAPFREIARQFEAENPGVKVFLEAAGSVDCARKITELNKPCDLMASSDYKVIEKFLIPGYTSWHIPFASNEMVIAFNEKSRKSDEIQGENWADILLDSDVRFARSDPASDPCGYRTLMTFQLAEDHYARPGLAQLLASKDRRYIRPKEVDLIALLEVGEIDYFFVYRSVALQHKLRYIEMPDDINLKSPAFAMHYQEASVTIPGKQPGDSIVIHGEPMIYSITLLDNSPNPEYAKAFLHFLLDPSKGMQVMEAMGQGSIVPSQSRYYEETSEDLKKYVTP